MGAMAGAAPRPGGGGRPDSPAEWNRATILVIVALLIVAAGSAAVILTR